MKYNRKRQYLQCFWWSSRMIMSVTKGNNDHEKTRRGSLSNIFSTFLYVLFVLSVSFIIVISLTSTIVIVDALELTTLSPRVVFTKQGPVQGFLGPGNVGAHYQPQTDGSYAFRHFSGRPVIEIFKSIPYASPPIGNLRYESPTPPPMRSRTQVYNANVSKPACPVSYSQILNRTSVPGDPIRALKKTMELEADDCLYLDIYLPLNTLYNQITGNKNQGSGLPVLVYANSQMDDPNDPFDGSSVAAIGKIMVISFRYRVGVLGFVRPGFSDDIRANFGLLDYLAALQWIKENVEEFGGDRNNICLLGYDLDATLAGLVSLSPVSKAYNGLFQRIILLNGSPFSPNSINHQPQKTTFHLARNLRCPLDERSGDLANCFRRTPIPQLFGAAESIGAPLLTYPFSPIADGVLVPADVSREDQRHSPSVLEMLPKYDLLCGLKEGPVLPRTGRPILRDIDLTSFVTAAIKLTLKLENDAEPTDHLKREVLKALTDVYGLTPAMREVVSDFLVVYPINELLKTHANHSGKNTFFYVFKDFDPLRLNKQNEISYIFSSKVYYWKYHSAIPHYRHLVGDPRTEELKPGYGVNSPGSDLSPFVFLISMLANFVRSGDPNVVDPNERYPNSVKPWPKFEENYGRYLELGKEVEFPSSYRKLTSNFWGRVFPAILKSFANQSFSHDHSNYDQFPPYFPPRKGTIDGNQEGSFGISSQFPDESLPPEFENEVSNEEKKGVLSGIRQNTVVLIGALLLLLNFMCFLGLFYQRERLKKTELQLRRRFLDSHRQNPEGTQEMDTASSFERATIPIHSGHNHVPHGETPARDAMSETETENGFGPDFLGPNYDPRTKVNRWMNMQNEHRAMLSKDNSFDNPSPSFSDFHVVNRRETDMPDPSITVLPLPPPLQPSVGLPPHPQHHMHHPPLHIQVTSLQRNSQPPRMMPIYDHPPTHHPPPPPPVQILPPLPYQEPFQPSASLVSDIPYADSRNTSPLTISSPVGYSNTSSLTRQQGKQGQLKMFGQGNPQQPLSQFPANQSTNLSSLERRPKLHQQHTQQHAMMPGTSSSSPTPIMSPAKSPPTPSTSSEQEKTSTSKRTSTLILKDLDPDTELSEPKLVPVKTGTLKRSVGVDTGHDGSPTKKEPNGESQPSNNNSKRGSSQIRVTFSEKV